MGGMNARLEADACKRTGGQRYREPAAVRQYHGPAGIRSRRVANVNGLTVHMLEAGFERPAGRQFCFSTAFRSSRTAGAR